MKKNNNISLSTYYDEEIERLVLGTLIVRRDAIVEAGQHLTDDCFYNDFHRKIFKAVKSIEMNDRRPDYFTVWRAIKGYVDEEKDWPLFLKITQYETFDIPQHVEILNHLKACRKAYEACQILLSSLNPVEDPTEIVEEAVRTLTSVNGERESGIVTMYDAVSQVVDMVNNNLKNGVPDTGSPTGFKMLDEIGVLRPSNLTVIAADSSQGKTSLATAFCVSSLNAGKKIAFYTMEMRPADLASRMISSESGVNGRTLVSRPLRDDELRDFDRSVRTVANLPMYFDGRSTSNIDNILASIRFMKMRHGIDGAVVDFLQILSVNGRGNDENATLGKIARSLKNIAKELNIWVLALSQLSRDKTDVAPNIARVRGSGQINEACDNMILLYRPEVYGREKRYPEPYSNVSTANTAMIELAKGRNMGTTKLICGFRADTTTFYNLDTYPINGTSSTGFKEEKPF